jgi:type II secretory pathway component PulK
MRQFQSSKFKVRKDKGVILPVVLFVLVLIGLLAAMFSFRVNADLAATQAVAMRLQTRLAAEAGVEYVRMVLRTSRFDRNVWYHNPEVFNRIIVTAHNRDAQTAGTSQEFDESMVYRFSIVADDPTDDKDYIRFGITDEASKLNLNTATESQLHTLVAAALGESTETDPQEIVDAILDWRDGDEEPRGETGDTERTYYSALAKPYRVKNGPFDTVEELLLVKGITPAILYGEDFDRNGLLTENEKDGDRTFPADNQDDILNRGLYAFLTVISNENNVANNNRPRTYLGGPEETVRTELTALFPDEPNIVDYIVTAVKKPPAQGGEGAGGAGGGSPAGQRGGPAGQGGAGGQSSVQQGGAGPPTGQQGGAGSPPLQSGSRPRGQQGGINPPPAGPTGAGTGTGTTNPGKPKGPKKQKDTPPQSGDGAQPQTSGAQSGQPGTPNPRGSTGQQRGPQSGQTGQEGQPQRTGPQGAGQQGTGEGEEGQQTPDGGGEGEGGEGGGQAENPPLTSPASLMLPKMVDGQETPSPLTVEHLAVLMDRTSMVNPEERTIPGLININTASATVLECLEDLSQEQIQEILATRDSLDSETLATTAWLVSEGIMEATDFEKVAPHITARGQQFTIESVGYADHMGMVTRLQVVVDMNGPIAQTVYYRDISNLGGAFPIREADKEKIRGR